MTKVTIHTRDGKSVEANVSKQDEAFYEDLPFTSANVLCTEVRPER